jgi:hypothetical protein
MIAWHCGHFPLRPTAAAGAASDLPHAHFHRITSLIALTLERLD